MDFDERLAARYALIKQARRRQMIKLSLIGILCVCLLIGGISLIRARAVAAQTDLQQVGSLTTAAASETTAAPLSNSPRGGLVIVATAPELTTATVELTEPDVPKPTVVIDAGHGGNDGGASRDGCDEKTINLDVSLKVGAALQELGYTVVYIRDHDEYFSTNARAKIANESGADCFVALHCNASEVESPYGIETYYNKRDPIYSAALAQAIHSELTAALDTKDRGVALGDYYVIRKTSMPAVLIEMGYISNDAERAKLSDDNYRQSIADAVVRGIEAYFAAQSEAAPE